MMPISKEKLDKYDAGLVDSWDCFVEIEEETIPFLLYKNEITKIVSRNWIKDIIFPPSEGFTLFNEN